MRIAKESKPKNDNKNQTKKKILLDRDHNLLGFSLQTYFLHVFFHISSQWGTPAFHLINMWSTKYLTSRQKKLIEIQGVWDSLHQEKAELLCKQSSDFDHQETLSSEPVLPALWLGHIPESLNLLWPQIWCINYCKNLGDPACEVLMLSSVMGCLCSGP